MNTEESNARDNLDGRASLDCQYFSRHGMTSQCMDHVIGNRDNNEMRHDFVAHD